MSVLAEQALHRMFATASTTLNGRQVIARSKTSETLEDLLVRKGWPSRTAKKMVREAWAKAAKLLFWTECGFAFKF